MAAGATIVPRDIVVLEFRGIPGAPRQHPLSTGRQEQDGVRPYTEWQRTSHRPNLGGDRRKLSAGRRKRHRSRGTAALRWCRAHHEEKLLDRDYWRQASSY